MSPERHKPSRGARKAIRELKSEFRSSADTNTTEAEKRRLMEEILEKSLPGESQNLLAHSRSIISDWFDTCLTMRDLDALTREKTRKAFIERHPREEIMEVREALSVITQTFSK